MFLCMFLCASVSQAAEWGVLAIPRNISKMKIEDVVDAIAKVQAIGANLNVNMFGWHDLEPNPEVYDIYNRLGAFEYAAKQGMTPYLGITLINTTKRDMPDDLLHKDWQDPVILERFAKLIEAMSKKLPKSVPYVVIGNEVDVYFEKYPDEMDAYLSFYARAKDIVKQYYPDAVVGISVTFDGWHAKNRQENISKVIAASDAAIFTFYPLFSKPPEPSKGIPELLDELIAASQSKDVYLQEVGFPTTDVIDANEFMQAEFFRTVIPAINARNQIKLASIFALHDLDPPICDLLTSYYGFSLSSDVHDFLCTLGLRDYEGKPKQAWGVVEELLTPQ